MPSIEVDKPAALADTRIKIALRDFPPRQPVTITATQTFPTGSSWRAQATFTSDDFGCIDVTRQGPTLGTYEGVDSMGLIWSAELAARPAGRPPADSIMTSRRVALEAEGPQGTRAETVLQRHVAGPGVSRHEVRSDGLVGTLFLPSGAGPHPGMIALSGGGGGINEYWGASLAYQGYAALALAYFNAGGLPRGLVDIPLGYFEVAIRWMRAQPWLRDHFLGVWGPSRGGELALLLGATFPEINAVVAWSGSGVTFWGLGQPEPGKERSGAAWTHRGKPLPYLQENNTRASVAPEESRQGKTVAWTPAYRAHLNDPDAVARATIPVEKIQGPVLLVSGGNDQMWPSAALTDVSIRRLEAHRHPHTYCHLKYEGAGHNILVPYSPTTVRASGLGVEGFAGKLFSLGGTPAADAAAGADAWTQTLAFLKTSREGGSR